MTETYQKLREEFKQLDLPSRLGFLVEAGALTTQSAIVGTLNVIGDVVEGVTNATGSLAQSVGISSASADSASQTVNRIVITVKDAGKAAGTVVKDVAKSVDDVAVNVAKSVGDATVKAAEVAGDVIGTVQKTAAEMAKRDAK